MIDLTPLEVRKKKGDFKKALRGYDPALVDDFLDVVADRLDELVRDNLAMTERLARLEHQVSDNRERERALTDALVTAQEMREEMQKQTARESDLLRRSSEQEAGQVRRTAEQDAAQIRNEAVQAREREEEVLRRLRARQQQLLQSYRTFLSRELAELQVIGETLEIEGMAGNEPPPPSPRARSTSRGSPRAPATVPAVTVAAAPVSAAPVSAAPVAPAATPEVMPIDTHIEHAVVMGAVEIEPLPEEEPFAPEPVEDLERAEAELALQDQLALRDGIARNEIALHEPPAVETLQLIDLDTLDFGSYKPADSVLMLDLEDAQVEELDDMADPAIGAPDHDATALLENALRAGYRLELDDDDDIEELLLDDMEEAADDNTDLPSDWLDRMIDDEDAV
ncbi:MAG: DivIVA domain-containing protein [Longimicrobiales bacterium]